MPRPHEETWAVDEVNAEIVVIDPPPPPNHVNPIFRDIDVSETTRPKLAAQAPAMARLLLGLQWSGENDGQTGPFCPICGGGEPGKKHPDQRESDPVGHEPKCELAAVLRAAGVLA